jgi:hypothetical protein
MRISTSALAGIGTGFDFRINCPGSPSTQAFMVSGIGNRGSTFTAAGAYIRASLMTTQSCFGLPGVETVPFAGLAPPRVD